MSVVNSASPGYLVLEGLTRMLAESSNATLDAEETHMVLTSVSLWRIQLRRLLLLQQSQESDASCRFSS